MAIRFCGNVRINCVYRDNTSDYKCSLSVDGRPHGIQYVMPLGHLTNAVDSPKAYDDTAHAAVAFALDDGMISESDIDFTDSGYRISRQSTRR